MIDNAYYLYFVTDLFLTFSLMKKYYGHNSHTHMKMLQKGILFLTCRLVAVYEAASYLSTHHLESRATPVLAR